MFLTRKLYRICTFTFVINIKHLKVFNSSYFYYEMRRIKYKLNRLSYIKLKFVNIPTSVGYGCLLICLVFKKPSGLPDIGEKFEFN